MVRFLGYCGPKIYEILHLNKQSDTSVFFRKKKKPEGERPALFAIESYLTGIVTSLNSSVGVCLAPEGWTVQP